MLGRPGRWRCVARRARGAGGAIERVFDPAGVQNPDQIAVDLRIGTIGQLGQRPDLHAILNRPEQAQLGPWLAKERPLVAQPQLERWSTHAKAVGVG